VKSITIILIASFLFIVGGCGGKKSNEDPPAQISQVKVRATSIKLGDMAETILANGQTEIVRKENLLSPIAGKISGLKVQEGSHVNAGDTLIVIMTRESESTLAGAEALAERAKTPEQKDEAKRALQLARQSQNLAIIKSSMTGIVAARNINEGAHVAEGTELLTIVDPASINFVAQVPLKELGRIASGQSEEIKFMALPDRVFGASINAISPQAEPISQTTRVRLHFDEQSVKAHEILSEGMAGTVRILTGTRRNVLIVPARAILRDDETNTHSIVIITPDSLSKIIPVTIGITSDSEIEISGEAITQGTPVIIDGNYALSDSTRVSAIQ
jgi:membrane fusion protein, multidrug efflux system